jgi:hypothetical protein
MTVSISPIWNGAQFFDNDGFPLSGGKIYQYDANSFSVQIPTYTTADGDVVNANPIVLDSSGRIMVDIWLTDGQLYNLVLKSKTNVILKSVDEVSGVKAATAGGGGETVIWTPTDEAPTYVSGTSFLVPGNVSAQFVVGNRVRTTFSDGTYGYGTVTAVSFTNPNTLVSIENDGSVLNSSLTAVAYSALITNGRTVDAGAVDYSVSTLAYTTVGTVGNKLRGLDVDVATVSTASAAQTLVVTTSGSGTIYALAPVPATSALTTTQSWIVKFHIDSGDAPTFNVSGLGALKLMMYDGTGAKIPAVVKTGQASQVIYDGTDCVVLDQLPPAALVGEPHGSLSFTTNGSFTPDPGVTSVRILVVGGGGGGGGSSDVGGGDNPGAPATGGTGGNGGQGWKTVSVTPGTAYAVTVGSGGVGGTPSYTSNHPATPGGNTIFGSNLVVATGGGAGGQSDGGLGGNNGGNGNSSGSTYGSNAIFNIAGAPKGQGAGPGLAGQAGMLVIEW